jgi:hypothetical protein
MLSSCHSFGEALGELLTVTVLMALFTAVGAWPAMLIVGALHHSAGLGGLPALGYLQCAGIIALVCLIVLPAKYAS